MNRFASYPRWTRRQMLWLLAGTASSITLHACARSTETSSTSTPSTAPDPSSPTAAAFGSAPWIGCTPLYIAQEKGFFQEAGLDLSVKTFGSNFEGLPAFSAGQLQGMAPITTSEAASLSDKGVDYRVVGVMDTSYGGDAILARNTIESIEDFKGKQVAVQEGGVGHFFLLQILAEAGLSEQDITIVNLAPDAAAAAYQSGNAEIAYTYSPFLEKANAAQPDGRIIYDSSKMPTAIIDLYVVSAEFAEQQPQAVEAFLSGIFQALDFLNAQPEEAHAIAAKSLGVEPEEVEAQLKGVRLPDLQTNLEMLGNPQSDLYLLESMTAMAEFLKAQDQIQTVPDVSETLDPKFLQALSQTV